MAKTFIPKSEKGWKRYLDNQKKKEQKEHWKKEKGRRRKINKMNAEEFLDYLNKNSKV